MTLRFWRRVRIFPGLRMNLSRSGVSLSVGRNACGSRKGHAAGVKRA
jgi:hypothetical protein